MYVGPPNVTVTDAGTNLIAMEFRSNAQSMTLKIDEVPIEAHNSIGKVERYHHSLKRAYKIIAKDLRILVNPDNILQMVVKAVNDMAGPQGLVPTLLVFGTYPRLTELSPPSPLIIVRANTIRKAMTDVRKLRAARQGANALSIRKGSNILDTIQLLQSEVKVWREKIGCTGPHILLARSYYDVTCTVSVDGKATNFRTVSVKPHHRDESTVDIDKNEIVDSSAESSIDVSDYLIPQFQVEQQQRKRGRAKALRNALKPSVVQNTLNTIRLSEKEKLDVALPVKLLTEGKITTPGKPFEELDRSELKTLIDQGVFHFTKFNPQKHGDIHIFKSCMVREVRGKATEVPHEKSRLVIESYSDNEKEKEKDMILNQSPTIQRASQRIIMALAPSILKRNMHMWLCDITQSYVQSHTTFQRTVLSYLPKQIRNQYTENTIIVVIMPLYGISEAGAYWSSTYFKHHCEQLRMITSTYGPCLLITTNNTGYFWVVRMQTDDTLG